MYEAARRELGDEAAETLMELLPPVGWADVATKNDLIALEERVDLRFQSLEERFDLRLEVAEHRILGALEQKLREQTRTMIFALAGITVSLAGVAIAT